MRVPAAWARKTGIQRSRPARWVEKMWRWRVERACPSLSENHHLYAGNEGATPSTSFTQRVASFTTDAHSLRSTHITNRFNANCVNQMNTSHVWHQPMMGVEHREK